MGVVFSLYKRTPKERYEIGKHRFGHPPDLAPSDKEIQVKVEALIAEYSKSPKGEIEAFNDYHAKMLPLTDPGFHAMWSIMGTPEYSVFRMTKWSRRDLAETLYRASQNIDDLLTALRVADNILLWCGDDEVTLNPEEPGDLAKLGWPTRGYRDTGSIWDAMRA